MSVESRLDEAFTLLLAKARQPALDSATAARLGKPTVAHFVWTGGGQPLSTLTADPVLVEVPFPCSIVWAHMFAFRVNVVAGAMAVVPVPVTATVEVLLTSFLTFEAAVPLKGIGVAPSLALQSTADIVTTGWQTELIPGDLLVAAPTVFTGLAPVLVLTLLLRPTGEDIGVTDLVEGTNDQIVDANGNPVILRG